MSADERRHKRLKSNSNGMAYVLNSEKYAWIGGRGLITFGAVKIGNQNVLMS